MSSYCPCAMKIGSCALPCVSLGGERRRDRANRWITPSRRRAVWDSAARSAARSLHPVRNPPGRSFPAGTGCSSISFTIKRLGGTDPLVVLSAQPPNWINVVPGAHAHPLVDGHRLDRRVRGRTKRTACFRRSSGSDRLEVVPVGAQAVQPDDRRFAAANRSRFSTASIGTIHGYEEGNAPGLSLLVAAMAACAQFLSDASGARAGRLIRRRLAPTSWRAVLAPKLSEYLGHAVRGGEPPWRHYQYRQRNGGDLRRRRLHRCSSPPRRWRSTSRSTRT